MKLSINVASKNHCSRLAMAFLLLAGIFGFLPAGNAQAGGNIIFVDDDAAGAGTGSSWADAYTDLQAALGAAGNGDQVWVAAGIYYPTAASDPAATFMLENGVALYGGFAGTEILLNERDPKANLTILSGDLGAVLDVSDNSYHVVTGDGTDHTAVLDGFTVTAGNATRDPAKPHGGGIYIRLGSPTLSNLVAVENTADFGGGMYLYAASPALSNLLFKNNSGSRGAGLYLTLKSNVALTHATFENNVASWRGGGMASIDSSPTLKNVTFTGNSAVAGGGLHTALGGNPALINVTFTGNTAGPASGGGIFNEESSPAITNVILYHNTGGEIYNFKSTPTVTSSIVKGGYDGPGNLDADPLLGALQDNGGFVTTMAPAPGSPAIDAGTDDLCPELDPRGVTRPQGARCDIGAYEVDNAAPLTAIDSRPPSLSSSPSASFTFSASDNGGSGVASLECQLDGAGYSSCTSPQSFDGLGDGGHTFQVRATDRAGNAGTASFSWVIDATPPETTIDSHPADLDTNTTPAFSFSGEDGPGSGISSFVCQVDDGAPGTCTSPLTLPALLPGPHTFSVSAIDQASNADLTPASYSWTVTRIPTRVSSILRTGTTPSPASSVAFMVKFSADVTGVDVGDFVLTTTGVSSAYIKNISGSGDTYTVDVTTGLRNGLIRLDIPASSDIVDGAGATLANLPYTGDETYSIVKTSNFADVTFSHQYYDAIEILYANRLAAGCGTAPLRFCPDLVMNRGEAAVLILRGTYGAGFLPASARHIFKDDWRKGPWAEPWAEAMRIHGLSAGCQTGPLKYCPWDQIPREQAAIFAVRLKYGISYKPPVATGTLFADMTNPGYYAAAWAEQAYRDGLIPHCGTSGGKPKFCPKAPVSRGLAAHMIVRAKNLTMP